MRFATRLLLVQLATQLAVATVCVSVFLCLGAQQLRTRADSSALSIARTVAASAQVRELVAAWSAQPAPPLAAALRDGPLQGYATEVAARTGSLFVVITDNRGIRLAHPDPARLGELVSTDFTAALAGHEVVSWETGTLGESARAKVPVRPPDGGRPVGEVSVGFGRGRVFDELPSLVAGIGLSLAGALALGSAAALLMRRRLERTTLGVQPEELVALVQVQTAVLEGSGDGVVALDEDGIVRVCTSAAQRMLGLQDVTGHRVGELGLAPELVAALRAGAPAGLAVGDRVIHVDVRAVRRGARSLGTAAVLRDRTDLVALSERLDSVRAMGDALRVQRHENANRLHAAVGLLDAGRAAEARDFLAGLVVRGPVDYAVAGLELVGDPMLQSFLGAKSMIAAERGVTLRVGEETFVRAAVARVEDVVAVLGNLVDNAVTAAAGGAAPHWVEVTMLDDEDALVLTVADSGAGIADPAAALRSRPPSAAPAGRGIEPGVSAVHGLGIGLPLSRELARRLGGQLWVVDRGGGGSGAVLAARLPGVMRPRAGAVPRDPAAPQGVG